MIPGNRNNIGARLHQAGHHTPPIGIVSFHFLFIRRITIDHVAIVKQCLWFFYLHLSNHTGQYFGILKPKQILLCCPGG